MRRRSPAETSSVRTNRRALDVRSSCPWAAQCRGRQVPRATCQTSGWARTQASLLRMVSPQRRWTLARHLPVCSQTEPEKAMRMAGLVLSAARPARGADDACCVVDALCSQSSCLDSRPYLDSCGWRAPGSSLGHRASHIRCADASPSGPDRSDRAHRRIPASRSTASWCATIAAYPASVWSSKPTRCRTPCATR